MRKNIKPYRSKDGDRGFGTPGEKNDFDGEKIDDYYGRVNMESVAIDLFASDNNTIYRSLVDPEKELLFDKLSNTFDSESLPFLDDFTDYPEPEIYTEVSEKDESIELKRRSLRELDEDGVIKAVEALKLYRDDFSFETLEDLFSMYLDKADDFFNIFKEFLREEKFNIFYHAFEEDRERTAAKIQETAKLPVSNNLCLVNRFIGTSFNLEESDFMLEVAGCTVSILVDTANAGYCPTITHCTCQCSLVMGIKNCLERYSDSDEYKAFIEEPENLINTTCEDFRPDFETLSTEPVTVEAESKKLEILQPEEKIENEFNFLTNLKSVASVLDFSTELEELKNEFVIKSSMERPISGEIDSLHAHVVLDKCELKNTDLKNYMQFDLDSCDVRDLYYCKNHYKGNKCLEFEKDKNDCNSACCLEIKMAECAKSHCLSKKPVKGFEKIANLICTEYADSHVTNGLPFPKIEEETNSEVLDKISLDADKEYVADYPNLDTKTLLEKRLFGNGNDKSRHDASSDIGESICELEEFEPGYDLTKCDKGEVKKCVKEGVQFLLDDPEHFCPYCVNNNAYDECRCACCFGNYFSKVCYDPNCGILTEKLRYKRYVREVCNTRPVKYLFARSAKEPQKLTGIPATEKYSTEANGSKMDTGASVVDEYKGLEEKKRIAKSKKPSKEKPLDIEPNTKNTGFDFFSGFESVASESSENTIYFEPRPVNIHRESLDGKRKSKLRYNFKLQNHKSVKRDTELNEYANVDCGDTHILYLQKGLSKQNLERRDTKSVGEDNKSNTRARSFAKPGSMSNKNKKKAMNKVPQHIKAQVEVTASAQDFGLGPNKQLKKKKPNKPKKTKNPSYIVDGPYFVGETGFDNPTRTNKIPHSNHKHEYENSIKKFDSGKSLYADLYTRPFDTLNENEELDNVNDSDFTYKRKTPFNLAKPITSRKRNPKVKVPKLSKQLNVFQRDILYKRTFDLNTTENRITGKSLTEYVAINLNGLPQSRTPKYTTYTRTVRHSMGAATSTPLETGPGSDSEVVGMLIIGGNNYPSEETLGNEQGSLTNSANKSSSRKASSNLTTHVTKTNYVTITSVLPKETTTTVTITKPNVSKTPTTDSNIATVTSIKTRFRPKTFTETEYEDYSTLTVTEYDDTLSITIPKKTITRHKGTTTETEIMKLTSTFIRSKTKTIPNITITEYEESDQTVTSLLTKDLTITETQFEDITTKTITTYSGTFTVTVAKKTVTDYRNSIKITSTETETEYDTEYKTKWYPEDTVTEYEDEETVTETKYYPITTTASTTASTTATTTTTSTVTLTSTMVGRARPQPNSGSSLIPRNYEEDQEKALNNSLGESFISNLTNKTQEKSSIADQLKPDNFTSDSSRLDLSVVLVIVMTAVTIVLFFYKNSLVVKYHEKLKSSENQMVELSDNEDKQVFDPITVSGKKSD